MNKGDKFEIEIAEVLTDGGGNRLYKIKGFNALIFDDYGLDQLKKIIPNRLNDPEIDWTKVPVDTPIMVRDSEGEAWKRRHFAKYKDGNILAWGDGGTSFSVNYTKPWNMAKLAKPVKE